MQYNLITILGPTAVGKTRLAAKLAAKFDGEIISADSRQVYVGMNVGTGKDLVDYAVDDKVVEYHLIDIITPNEEFNLYEFTKRFFISYSNIIGKGKIPFLAGGTGLYLSSILQNYKLNEVSVNQNRRDELSKLKLNELIDILIGLTTNLHNSTDILDKERTIQAILVAESNHEIKNNKIAINSLNIGVAADREMIKKRITERLKKRLREGMIEEVDLLMKSSISKEKLDFFGLEYRYVSKYLLGELNYNDMFQKLNSSIHAFAKRQMTWFRKMEKEGVKIHWIQYEDYNSAEKILAENHFSI
jgi:tRNA dimethylallyltransferase